LTEDLVAISSTGATVVDGINGASVAFTQGSNGAATETNAILKLSAISSSAQADNLLGLDIANLTGGAASEIALRVGTGWDVDQRFLSATAKVQFADAGTLTF